jgi:glycosyltransferase involved in cell wall biosynthesis
MPECTVAVVGRSPSKTILALSERDSKIHVTGTLPDVRPWLWGAKLSIVPLRIGGGTRLKIYESMAAGTTVVSTRIGAEGLDVEHPTNIRLADTPSEFAEQCIMLMRREHERTQVALNALNLVSSRFSWDAVATEFENVLLASAQPTTA